MVDLTVAIQVGVVMAAILFMHRMAGVVPVEKGVEFLQGDVDDAQIPALDSAFQTLPAGVERKSLRGPRSSGPARTRRGPLQATPRRPPAFTRPLRNVPMFASSRVNR